MARILSAIAAFALLAVAPAEARQRGRGVFCAPVYIEGAGQFWICPRRAR